MDLNALRNREATVTLLFDEQRLRFTYNPHNWNDECQRIINGMRDDEDNTALCAVFETMLTSWDMKEGSKPVPCDYDGFMAMMPFLRSALLSAIVDDIQERGKLKPSDNSSNRGARSGLVKTGTSNSSTSNGREKETPATS